MTDELLDTPCDINGHQPVTEDVGSGDGWDAPIHVMVTTCAVCGVDLQPTEPDEDGLVGWETI